MQLLAISEARRPLGTSLGVHSRGQRREVPSAGLDDLVFDCDGLDLNRVLRGEESLELFVSPAARFGRL